MDDSLLAPIPGIESLTYEDVNMVSRFQRLWLRVTYWLRSYFKSSLMNSPDLEQVTVELFSLPQELYNSLTPYFTEEVARHVYEIFYYLIYINYQLVNAYKDKDTAAITDLTLQWYSTAAQWVSYLASINPFWDIQTMNKLLFDYGRLKVEEIIAYYEGNFAKEITIFNELEQVAIEIANFTAQGIIQLNAARARQAAM